MSIAAKTQLSVLAGSPGGINRMRALIARLAFQGALSTVTASEWKVVSLGSVVSFQNGYAFKSEWFSSGGVRLARNTNIGHGELEWNDCAFLPENLAQEFSAFKLQAGDILISLNRPVISTGLKVAVVKESDLPCLLIQRVAKLTPAPESLDPDFLLHWLRSPLFVDVIDPTPSSGVPYISTKQMAGQSISLPSLAEQHRIVAKVDELMALCDRLEARQQDAEAAHARLVQALLDSLTQARDAQEFQAGWERLAGEFGAVFSREESVVALRQAVIDWATSGNFRSGCDSVNWRDGCLGDFVVDSGSGWSPSCDPRQRTNDEWGVLKVSAVSWGVFRPDENKALPANLTARPEFEVHAGDFLISRANTAELVARSVFIESAPPKLMLSDKIVRLHFSDGLEPRFAQLVNSSTAARGYYAKVAGGTSSSMKNVTRMQILALPIKYPDLAEQRRIVAKVSELLALCDQLKARIAAGRAKQAQLAEALVKQAVAAG